MHYSTKSRVGPAIRAGGERIAHRVNLAEHLASRNGHVLESPEGLQELRRKGFGASAFLPQTLAHSPMHLLMSADGQRLYKLYMDTYKVRHNAQLPFIEVVEDRKLREVENPKTLRQVLDAHQAALSMADFEGARGTPSGDLKLWIENHKRNIKEGSWKL